MKTLVRRPGWFFRNIVQGPEYILDRRRHTGVEPFRHLAKPEAEAAALVADVDVSDYDRAVTDLWTPEPDPIEPLNVWSAREALLRLVGAIVKLVRPGVMIETGVALGFTTATILRAMDENAKGTLHSIDLPALQYDPDRAVGAAVPPEIKDRWNLQLGDSRRLLGSLAAAVSPIDIFLHDALHTYSSQRREYTTVWPYLRTGGILISDDVENPALIEFAEKAGVEPQIVLSSSRLEPGATSAIGLLRKP